MEIKYQFPSLSRKYDTEEYIYDANVTDYIEEVSRRHPGKEIELAREAWKDYKDTDQNISDLAEENEIKSLNYAKLGAIGVIELSKEIIKLKQHIKELEERLNG